VQLIDLGVNNYLGRQAQARDLAPCCNRHTYCRDVAFPTSLSLHDLLKKPPYLFRSHLEAFKRMKELISLATLQGDIIPSRILNEFAACLDYVFFGTTLMSRVDISWCTLGEIIEDCVAYTSAKSTCSTHRQVHYVTITLDPSKKPERSLLRRCYQNDIDAVLPEWLERVFGSLVHEMCHARLLLSMDRLQFFVGDFLRVYGSKGHGLAIESLFKHVAGTLERADMLHFDMQRMLHRSVRDDKRFQDKVVHLADEIDGSELRTSEIRKLLVERLHVPEERVRLYRKAMHADYTSLEIVTLIHVAGTMNFKLAKDRI